jgi:hypothetical protein
MTWARFALPTLRLLVVRIQQNEKRLAQPLVPDFAVAQFRLCLLLHSLLQRFGHKFMHQIAVAVALSLAALASAPSNAAAEMGPCLPDDHGSLTCGNGDGAARIIPKTTSPSNRLALAWRMTNRPPTDRSNDNESDLESLIVRIEDGAILVKSQGTYWDIGERTAKGQRAFAAWSPDSRLLVRGAERVGAESAELFVINEGDAVIGPFDLVKVLDPAVRADAKCQGCRQICAQIFL